MNPLTELPGNSVIDRLLNHIINDKSNYSVLYFDLDNLKIYNDIYGFENGDEIIIFTWNIIQHEIKSLFGNEGFIGHIGGDDFIFVKKHSYEECEILCKNIIARFESEIKDFLMMKILIL